jgi:hypothetical protein
MRLTGGGLRASRSVSGGVKRGQQIALAGRRFEKPRAPTIGKRYPRSAAPSALVWQGPLEEDEGERADTAAEWSRHGIGKRELKRKGYLD